MTQIDYVKPIIPGQHSTLFQSLSVAVCFFVRWLEMAWALLSVMKNTGCTVGYFYAAMSQNEVCMKTGRLNYDMM